MKKLVIYCDVNGVVIPFDTSTNMGNPNDYIDFVVADRVMYNKGSISLNDKSKLEFGRNKQSRLDFIRKQLSSDSDLLKKSDLLKQCGVSKPQNKDQVPLFESFKKFLEKFQNKFVSGEWKLILRTFGHDGESAAKSCQNIIFGGGVINEYDVVHKYVIKRDQEYYRNDDGMSIDHHDIYSLLNSPDPVLLIQDDPTLWLKSNEDRQFGKPLWIFDEFDTWFFDDNFRPNDELQNIANPLRWSLSDHCWEQQKIQDTKNLIKVDRYDALENPFYFIDKINNKD